MSAKLIPVFVATVMLVSTASADESLSPIAQSGSWIALEHRESMTSPPDMCVAFDVKSGIAFRSEGSNIQFRVQNKDWSLPAGVHGSVVIHVANYAYPLEIDDNTSTMVNATIPADVPSKMFSEMDQASAMTVLVGKDKPISVSLSGSTKVTNAFRTCAGIEGNVATPGSNPFQ